jgi:hypothetical protein
VVVFGSSRVGMDVSCCRAVSGSLPHVLGVRFAWYVGWLRSDGAGRVGRRGGAEEGWDAGGGRVRSWFFEAQIAA